MTNVLQVSKRPSEQGLAKHQEASDNTAWGGQDGREWVQLPLPLPPLSPPPASPGLDSHLHSLAVLSKPRVINIRKKTMAKNVDAGMLAMASAYVMNRRLGPETGREEEVVTETCPTDMSWGGNDHTNNYDSCHKTLHVKQAWKCTKCLLTPTPPYLAILTSWEAERE